MDNPVAIAFSELISFVLTFFQRAEVNPTLILSMNIKLKKRGSI
jgi:hypothetical protein